MTQLSPVQPASRTPAPALGGCMVTADGRVLSLQGVDLHVDARGGLARVMLEQCFRNPLPEPRHVTYLLPLPVDGAVSAFAFRIGARRITGEIDRRALARERFDEAIAEGRTAALLEQERTNLFTQELGNIPPDTEVVAELTIDQRLRWVDAGGWEWRFPTVVAPRYLGQEGRVPDASRIMVDVADSASPVRAGLTIVIRDALTPGGAAESPSHALREDRQDGHLAVSLADMAGMSLDRDVVVRWPVATPAVGITLDPARPQSGRPHGDLAYGLLTLVPPSATESTRTFPRDLILLLDTSGSMTGAPLAQSQAMATALVETLNEQDQLELIAFADRPHRWRSGAVRATPTARAQARRWLDGLEARGGTEMADGVAAALRPLRPDAQRQVILITDGLIGFEQEIVAAVARDLPPASRLHTVGVGPAVNRSLTAAAARAGRGAEVILGLDEPVDETVGRLVARTSAPLVTDIRLDGPALVGSAPAHFPDLLARGPAVAAIALRPEGGHLRVRGQTPAGTWETAIYVPAVAPGTGNPAVVTLYGREAVEDLDCRRAAGETAVDAEIERLGLAFQIATRATSWVAVSEEPTVDPTQPARRQRIPHLLPDGLSIAGLGLRSASVSRAARFAAPRLSISAVAWQGWAACPDWASPPRPAHLLPRAQAPAALPGRLVRRRGRDLIIEITLDRPLDWRPTTIDVRWADGTSVTATVDLGHTTRMRQMIKDQVLRLVLRLDAEGPATEPVSVIVTGGAEALTVRLTAP